MFEALNTPESWLAHLFSPESARELTGCLLCRNEEVLVRHLLTIWKDPGCGSDEEHPASGAGMDSI